MQYFIDEYIEVNDCNDKVMVAVFVKGMRLDWLFYQLADKNPKSLKACSKKGHQFAPGEETNILLRSQRPKERRFATDGFQRNDLERNGKKMDCGRIHNHSKGRDKDTIPSYTANIIKVLVMTLKIADMWCAQSSASFHQPSSANPSV